MLPYVRNILFKNKQKPGVVIEALGVQQLGDLCKFKAKLF